MDDSFFPKAGVMLKRGALLRSATINLNKTAPGLDVARFVPVQVRASVDGVLKSVFLAPEVGLGHQDVGRNDLHPKWNTDDIEPEIDQNLSEIAKTHMNTFQEDDASVLLAW